MEEKETLTTNQLLGHWHGTPEAKILNHCANRHEVSSQIEIAKKEFFDTVKCIEVQFNRSQREQILSQIEKKEFSQLSEEEKEMLKSLNKGIK